MKFEAASPGPEALVVSWRKLLVVLLGIDIVILFGSWVRFYIPRTERLLHLNGEANIPAWFSGLQITLICLPTLARGLQLRQWDRSSHWRIYIFMAAGFLFLATDEIVQIHEPLGHALHLEMVDRGYELLDARHRGLIPAVIYGVIGLAVLIPLRRDVRALLSERVGSMGLIVGLAVYATGGVLVDVFAPPFENFYLREAAVMLEEGLEMVGMSILLVTFLSKLGAFTLVVTDSDGRSLRHVPAKSRSVAQASEASLAS